MSTVSDPVPTTTQGQPGLVHSGLVEIEELVCLSLSLHFPPVDGILFS